MAAKRWRGPGDGKVARDRREAAAERYTPQPAQPTSPRAEPDRERTRHEMLDRYVAVPGRLCPPCATEVTIAEGDQPAQFFCPRCQREWWYHPVCWNYGWHPRLRQDPR